MKFPIVRSGDLRLGVAETITARDVRLVADGGAVNDGNIDIAGTIDARGARGGQVELWAARDLNLRNGAEIDASATAADQRGGSVLLATRDSSASGIGINVESGATNNVAGRALVVHRDPDDFKTQPAGNSGPRTACAVITKG